MFKRKVFVVLLSPILVLWGCGTKENAQNENKKEENNTETVTLSRASMKEIGLQSETVNLKPFTGHITIPAKVITNQDQEAQVGSLVQGRVFKVYVKVGDFVTTGQDLMLVEGLEIGGIKAEYLTAKASLEFQKVNFERQKALIEQKVGSQRIFLETQAEYEKAIAEFNAHDKKIHSIGLTDEEVTNGKSGHADEHTSGTLPVKAPINGIVVERNVVIGQFVDGTTNAFKIFNPKSVWIDGQLYEKDITKINEKTKAVFTTSSYPADTFIGKVFYIGLTIDEKSQTITIRSDFNNPLGKLKPQMFGELQLPVRKSTMAILIPAESIVKINNADFVFVQMNDSSFEKRSVVVGSTQNEVIEIKEGLKENEKIIVQGVFYLKSELMKEELEGGE